MVVSGQRTYQQLRVTVSQFEYFSAPFIIENYLKTHVNGDNVALNINN